MNIKDIKNSTELFAHCLEMDKIDGGCNMCDMVVECRKIFNKAFKKTSTGILSADDHYERLREVFIKKERKKKLKKLLKKD